MNRVFRYRIYTEDKHYRGVIEKVTEMLDGFTVFFAVGLWEVGFI